MSKTMPQAVDVREQCTYKAFDVTGVAELAEMPLVGFKQPPVGKEALRDTVIPECFTFNPEIVRAIGLSLYRNRPLCITGLPGCGKTSTLVALLTLLNWDWEVVTGNRYTEPQELLGTQMPDGKGGVEFVLGPVARLYKNGGALIVDERDRFNPGTSTALHQVLDGYPLELPFLGETILRHPQFRVFGTANTAGNGEGIEIFTAAEIQDQATNRRWWIVNVDFLPEEEEVGLIGKKFPDANPTIVQMMVKFANATRKLAKEGRSPALSTAELLDYFLATSVLSAERQKWGLGLVYMNKLTPAQRAAAEEAFEDLMVVNKATPTKAAKAAKP